MSGERPKLDFYVSFISLWSYIGSNVLRDLVRDLNVEVSYKPIDLLAAFAAGGGKPVKERATFRQSYRLVEMERWKAIRNIPLVTWPKFYPADPSIGHRMLLAAIESGQDVGDFVHHGLKAVWADELNIADPETLVALADRSGLNGKALLARVNEPRLVEAERRMTAEAVERQVFGAPFYFYRGEPFWGQDRLDMLRDVIASNRPAIVPPRVEG